MKSYKYYVDLNKLQPVKIYSPDEIKEYCKNKPPEFFEVPSKYRRLVEKWIDKVFPKTAVNEVEEIKNNTENHRHIRKDLIKREYNGSD